MIPSFLVASYKQYKADSDAVAAWLAKTALTCGYPKDLRETQAALEHKGPRLKGKARKLAQQASQKHSSDSKSGASKPKPVPEGPKYLISIEDFISLAEWIVKSTKFRVDVPASFVSVLDRAITVRKRHHNWWYRKSEKEGGNSDQEKKSNQSHDYFIGVLERIREILRPRMSPELRKDLIVEPVERASTSKKPAIDHMVNLFENLAIEEPSEAFLNFKPIAAGQRPNNTPQVEYRLNRAQDLEEVRFAVHCLFNDFNNIREYLQQVWDGYKQGAFDLVAASITTNTAIDFARHLQEDFDETFPKDSDFEKHINDIYYLSCVNANQDPRFKNQPDDEMNFEAYEDVESTFFPAYMILSSFHEIIEPGQLPVYKPGYFGSYDPRSERADKVSKHKFREDKVVLLENLPDFCVVAQAPESIPAEDEMSRGMREMVKDGQLPIWLVFAAQIYLDIHHTLRQKVSNGFHDLVKSARYVEKNIQQILLFHRNLRIDNWPKSNDEGLFRILDLIKHWVNLDAVHEVRCGLTQGFGMSRPLEPFLFLKNHPWYCGLLSYCIKAAAQETSIIFVNAWGSILYSAHLYNALRQERLITNAWPDMDLALLMHKTEDMFVGDFPKAAFDYFKRFSLAMGYSASNFVKNRRHDGIVASRSGPRKLNQLSPVCRMFKARYCSGENRTSLSPDDVNTILERQGPNGSKPPKNVINVQPPVFSTDEIKPFNSENRPKKARISATVGLQPIQLLNALLHAIQSEMLELTFDHFRLHIFSWSLLRNLRETLNDEFLELYGPGYLEKDNQLPFVVGYILMAGSEKSRLANVLAPKKKDVVTDQLLIKAAEVMSRMLKMGSGQSELGMLKELGIDVKMPDFWELASSRSANNGGGSSSTEEGTQA